MQNHRDEPFGINQQSPSGRGGCPLAWELWQLGYPDQAMQHSQAALTLAQEGSHPHTLAQALVFAAFLRQFRREASAVFDQAKTAMTLTTEQGFTQWFARGMPLHGWALAMQGQSKKGITEIRQGLDAEQATGAKSFQPYFLGLLAEAYGAGRDPKAGLEVLNEALAVMDTTEVRFYAAELYRVQGDLLLKQDISEAIQAEACFQQALSIAQFQQSKSFELRTATSLGRLWQSQDKRQEAYDLLAPVYEWFTEGFDTTDLIDARSLLDELHIEKIPPMA